MSWFINNIWKVILEIILGLPVYIAQIVYVC